MLLTCKCFMFSIFYHNLKNKKGNSGIEKYSNQHEKVTRGTQQKT
jgi:hypothetical protein